MNGSPILLVLRTIALIIFLVVVYVAARLPTLVGGKRLARGVIGLSMGMSLKIFGITVAVGGEKGGKKPAAPEPAIVVAPHYSWLDPMVLTHALGGKVRFVATEEIKSWPLFGALTSMHDTIFIDRTRRNAVTLQKAQIENALKEGFSVIFFPEGASGGGNRVRRFKSSLFSVAMETGAKVRPISMAYRKLDGIPMMRIFRPFYAWYGGVDLFSHMMRMLGSGRAEVSVVIGKLLEPKNFADRKQLALSAERQITAEVGWLMTAAP